MAKRQSTKTPKMRGRTAPPKIPKRKAVSRSTVYHGLDRIDQALHELHDVVKLLGLIIDNTDDTENCDVLDYLFQRLTAEVDAVEQAKTDAWETCLRPAPLPVMSQKGGVA